jgi:hypothetical protein
LPEVGCSLAFRKRKEPAQTDRLKRILRTRFITCELLDADGEVWMKKATTSGHLPQIAQFRQE